MATDSDHDGKGTIYASPETKAQLGWIVARMPEWTGERDIILISRDDIARTEGMQKIIERNKPEEIFQIELIGVFPEGTVSAIFNEAVSKTGYDMTARPLPAATAYIMTAQAYTANPSALSMRLDTQPGQSRDVCLITLPDLNMTGQDIAMMLSGLSGVADADSPRFPGNTDDWRLTVLAHESVHCTDNQHSHEAINNPDKIMPRNTLFGEITADKGMIDIYRRELALGNATSPDVPSAFADVRALGAILNNDYTHSTSPALDTGGIIPVVTPRKKIDIDLIFQEATMDKENPVDSHTRALDKIDELKKKGVDIDENPDFENTYGGGDILEMLKIIKSEAYGFDQDEALIEPQEKLPLLYQSVRTLLDDGMFDFNPGQKSLAMQFLDAAARYAPKSFQVDDAAKGLGPDADQPPGLAPYNDRPSSFNLLR